MSMSLKLAAVLCFAVAGLLTIACRPGHLAYSDAVPPGEIYQQYEISAGKFGSSAVGIYRQGGRDGKVVQLVSPANVKFNNELLYKDTRVYADSCAYTGYYHEPFVKNEFVFTAADGKSYTNTLNLEPVEFTLADRIDLDRSQDIILPLSRVIAPGERLETHISNSEPHLKDPPAELTRFIKLENNLSADRKTIIIKPGEIKDLQNGRGTISVVIKSETPLQQSTPASGHIAYEYRSELFYMTIPK